jgi:glutamyl endopeptidase
MNKDFSNLDSEHEIFESAGFLEASSIPEVDLELIFEDHRKAAGTVAWLPALTSIAYLEAVSPNGGEHGTGWFLTPRIVITAAHILFPDGKPVSHAVVTPGSNGPAVRPFGSFQSSVFAAAKGWLADQDPRADVAAIRLTKPVPVTPLQPAALSDNDLKNGEFIMAGYPSDKPPGTLWGMQGPILKGNAFLLHHKLAVRGGQSGGPLFRWVGDAQQVVGIQSGSDNYNRAIRIHSDLLKLFTQWAAS